MSHPIDGDTVTERTVALSGPDGIVAIQIVVAEQGRLLFVRPFDPLAPGTAYQLVIDGVRDHAGLPLEPSRLTFTTIDAKPTEPSDTESWVPDLSRRDWRSD